MKDRSDNPSHHERTLLPESYISLLHSITSHTNDTINKNVFIASLNIGVRCSSVVRAFAHGEMGCRIDSSWGGPIDLFIVPASGMFYPVCGMVYIKEPLLFIRKSSLCGRQQVSLSLSEWSFTICPTPYNSK